MSDKDISHKWNALPRRTRILSIYMENMVRTGDLERVKNTLTRNHKRTIGEIDDKIKTIAEHNRELVKEIEPTHE